MKRSGRASTDLNRDVYAGLSGDSAYDVAALPIEMLEASLLADAVHEDNSDMLWPRRGCAHDAGAPTPSFLGGSDRPPLGFQAKPTE
jgi:hypothetical protein